MARDGAARTAAKLNVFISYSREDIAFVDRLQAALLEHGVEAFVDREQIEKGEAWWARIQQLITEADTIVFVLSPGSVDSKVCKDEVAFAERLNKRFVPIVARDPQGRAVPDALARLNYIFFIPNPTAGASGDFDPTVADLVRALETDIPWIREHTRLGALAERWQTRKRPVDLLLRGAELNAAESWLTTRPDKAPDPTDAHRALLTLSRRAASRRQQVLVAASLAAVVVASALAGVALWQRNDARLQRDQALLVQSRFLADLSRQSVEAGDAQTGALLALEALPDNAEGQARPFEPLAEESLIRALHSRNEVYTAGVAQSAIRDVVLSPDRKTLAELSIDGKAFIRATETGLLLATLQARDPDSQIDIVWFSSDNKTIFTWSGHIGALSAWSMTGELRKSVESESLISSFEYQEFFYDGTFAISSPDGASIAVVTSEGSVLTFDSLSLASKHAIKVSGRKLMTDYIGSALLVATTDTDNVVSVLNGETGDKIAELRGHADAVQWAKLSPDGTSIVTCSGHFDRYVNKDATARIWDIKTGSQKFILEGHKTRVLRATFDHTGSLIVTSSDATRIWDAANGAQLATTSDTFEGFSPDDTSLLYRTTDGEVHIRDANGALQQSFKYYNSERINGASFGVDSSTVVTWHDDGSIRAHSFVPNPGRIVASRSFELGRDTKYSKYLDIAFSPDGKRVAMAGIGGVEIFDTTNGSKLDQFEQPTNKVAFGSSDSELLSASDDGAVRVENVVNRNATSEFRVDGTPLRAFSAGSRFLVVSAKDSVGEIWDARSGELISRLVGHTGEITSAAISRSAEFCATASKDNTLRIWRLSDGALLKTLEREVSGVEFSQLGNLLAAVGPSDVLVWDVKTGKERVTLDSRAVAVAFSRGDTRIVLGDRIGRAEIWDLGSGKLVHSFEHRLRTVPMVHVAFNPVADSLLLTWTGGFELWKFYSNVEDLVQASKTDATRCLTSKQRSDAFLSEDAPSWCSRMRKWPTGTASDIDPMQ